MILARYLEERVTIDRPINIHVTGCPNSCAQHYIGDIGLEGTKVEVGEEMVEGYHLCVGGGYGAEQGVGRRLIESMPFDDDPARRRAAAPPLPGPPPSPTSRSPPSPAATSLEALRAVAEAPPGRPRVAELPPTLQPA